MHFFTHLFSILMIILHILFCFVCIYMVELAVV